MSDDKSKKLKDTMEEVDLRLDGLLGKLGTALGEVLERLEQGETAELRRDQEIDTPRGPLRAETGVRVRLGGLTANVRGGAFDRSSGAPAASDHAFKPDAYAQAKAHRSTSEAEGNGARDVPSTSGEPEADASSVHDTEQNDPRAGTKSPEETAPRQAHLESYTAGGRWILCADLPGVSLPEVEVEVEAGQREIVITTTGTRRYLGSHDLPPGVDTSDLEVVLRNGVLEISVALEAKT